MNNKKILYQVRSLEISILRKLETEIEEKFMRKNNPPTLAQMRIMDYILHHEKDGVYQKNLENALNIRRATVSGVLQTMEKNNLINRVSCDNDARIKKIILNDKARNMFLTKKCRLEKIEDIVVRDISDEELNTFSTVLNKMIKNINN